MLVNLFSIVIGFILLVKGADVLVNGASTLARRLGIPSLVVGLTVVAFGTSAPELFVNVIASIQGSSDIAIGNVLGSNLANILVILGVTSMIAPLTLKSSTVWKEIPFSLLAAMLVLILGADMLLDGASMNVLSRVDGLVLLSFFIIFIVYTFGIRDVVDHAQIRIEQISLVRAILFVIGGLVALVIGGQFVVGGATDIAVFFGVSQNLIALTIVAIGTSLPELVTSFVAARKGQQDLAIGNVVGSNIFNIFLVLGVSATIAPLPFTSPNVFDSLVVVLATMIMFFLLFVGKRHVLHRTEGMVFVFLYVAFIIFAIVRG